MSEEKIDIQFMNYIKKMNISLQKVQQKLIQNYQ